MNGIIVINKEKGYTSHDVIAKLRGILRVKKIGHTGTLDPDATGVLPVCLGSATKVCDLIMDRNKEYIAGVRLGITTDTQDISGRIIEEKRVNVTYEALLEAANSLVGDILQETPMYSARKVNGQKLVDLARRGIEVEREKKPITIHSIEISDYSTENATFSMKVRCSKGTYIRTICHDIGQILGCGACMTSLVRTASGEFNLEHAYTLEQVEQLRNENRIEEILLQPDTLFQQYGYARIKDIGVSSLLNGNPLSKFMLILEDESNLQIRVYLGEEFMALYEWRQEHLMYYPIKMFLPNRMNCYPSMESYDAKRCAVMLGKFDGLHLGHRAILSELMETKRNLPATVLAIDFPPSFGKVLFTKDEKKHLFEQVGLEAYISVDFQDIRELSPEQFVQKLKEQCKASIVYVGEDFRFGHQRSGDAKLLKNLCEKQKIEVHIINQVEYEGEIVSCTAIRELVQNGETEKAALLLGTPYRIEGFTQMCRQLGRTIGFPTLNLLPDKDKLIPPDGVYETDTVINGKAYPSITNIGKNPTVSEDNPITVETHLLKFPEEGIGYQAEIKVYFGRRIRGECKFASLDELRAQIQKDKEIAENRTKPIYKA